jgi:DNA-binding response OmpR family regulator
MPIVDGLTSTKMIRMHEQTDDHAGLSLIANSHGHIPVIAVSASLIEREKDTYVNAGFDGWILKPIDFKRLETLLQGIVDDGVRDNCLYVSGEWERGGWFTHRLEPEPTHRLKKKTGKAELRLEDIAQREETPSTVG